MRAPELSFNDKERSMPRTRFAVALFFYASFAFAQPFKVEPTGATDASTDASPADASTPAPVWPRAPEPTATTSSSSGPRPDPGPGLRERGGRTRRANPASGILLVLLLAGAVGWYVKKRLRRF
jgi:hypothetical protein